jgi:hypothetical protein
MPAITARDAMAVVTKAAAFRNFLIPRMLLQTEK